MDPRNSPLNILNETLEELLIDPAQNGELLEETVEEAIATVSVMQQKGEFS